MERPPRNPRESVFTWDVKTFILLALVVETPFFYFIFFHDLAHIAQARTEIFFLFIIVELALALNFRSLRFSAFKVPPHRWLILAVLSQLVLAAVIIQLPSVRNSFGVTIPTLSQIGLIVLFSAVVFLSMEIIKAALRKKLTRVYEQDVLSS
jgi:Ca2+-transporting ATPase